MKNDIALPVQTYGTSIGKNTIQQNQIGEKKIIPTNSRQETEGIGLVNHQVVMKTIRGEFILQKNLKSWIKGKIQMTVNGKINVIKLGTQGKKKKDIKGKSIKKMILEIEILGNIRNQKNRKEVALWGKKGEFYISERWRFEVQITL